MVPINILPNGLPGRLRWRPPYIILVKDVAREAARAVE